MVSRREEDYLETILDILEDNDLARTKEIASNLDVKAPTVVEMLEKLENKKLVNHVKYKGVKLTEYGEKKADSVKYRHETIEDFLKILNVPDEIANNDACVMEHELHPETIEQIRNLVKFVETHPRFPRWLEHFEYFCETGKHKCDEG